MNSRQFSIVSSIVAAISSFQFGLNMTYMESLKDVYLAGQPLNKILYTTEFTLTRNHWAFISSIPFFSGLIGHLLANMIHKGAFRYKNNGDESIKTVKNRSMLIRKGLKKAIEFISNYILIDCRYLNLIIFGSFLFFFGTFLIFIAPSLYFILIGRFIIGIAVGISSFIIPIYISHINSADDRGFCGSFHQLFITFGVSSGQLVSLLFHEAKYFLVIYGIVFFVSISHMILLRTIQRVPENLASADYAFNGGIDDWISNGFGGVSNQENKQTENNKRYAKKTTKINEKSLYVLLRTPAAYKSLFLSILFHIGQQMSGITSVTIRSNDIFENYNNPRMATFFVGIISILSNLICMLFIDRAGRKKCMFWSILVSFFGLLGIYISLERKNDFGFGEMIAGDDFLNKYVDLSQLTLKSEIVTLLGVSLFLFGYSLGLGPVVWMITSELFPIEFQSSAILLSVAVNWIFTFCIPLTTAFVECFWKRLPYLVNMGFLVFMGIVLHLFYRETKGKDGAFQ